MRHSLPCMKRLALLLAVAGGLAWSADGPPPGQGKGGKPASPPLPASPAPPEEREGLERGSWTAEGFGNPVTLRVVRPKGQENNRLLRVRYQAGAAAKAAAKRLTGLAAAAKGTLRVHIYSAEKNPPKVALALCTGEAYLWQETQAAQLKTGWNRLTFRLDKKNWKSASSQWKNEAPLRNRGDVRAIELLVFNGKSEGRLYVDALNIDRDGQTPGIRALIKQLGAPDFGQREQAEQALLEVGRPALESLNEALESPDPEIALRARRLIKRLLGHRRGAEPKKTEGRREKARAGKRKVIQVKPRKAEVKE